MPFSLASIDLLLLRTTLAIYKIPTIPNLTLLKFRKTQKKTGVYFYHQQKAVEVDCEELQESLSLTVLA